MDTVKILEYAIFHDNLKKKISLPGIKDGVPQESFFNSKSSVKLKDFEEFTSYTVKNSLKKVDKINLLCSGGVDSSLLVYYLKKYNKKFLAIHNFYPKHNLNDLKKINSLKKFFKFNIKKVSISSSSYLKGMKLSFKKKYFGNTYAPTLYYSINLNKKNTNKILMTGSGPDELFYGMEKYDLNFFKKLSNLKTPAALEKIDTNYNDDFYLKILNAKGIKIYKHVKNERLRFYNLISKINKNLIEAQRILSYCTVSNQHFEMFEKLSKNFNLQQVSPFFDENYIKFAFSHKLRNFLNLEQTNKIQDSNIGKKHLKQLLTKYTSHKHAYDFKIGFHAPVTQMIKKKINIKNFTKILDYEKLEILIDIDKLNRNLEHTMKFRLNNYNLYSILGIQEMINQS